MPTPLASVLQLKPQTRTVLAHLESGDSISPLEAWAVYGISRLAARIYDLRKAGYEIERELRRDKAGHPYARYFMKGEKLWKH
jgi:hypothetical protein